MDTTQTHFALFGLVEAFAIDPARLDQAFHQIQGEVHPDRFASAGGAAKRVAMQWATRANEAYQCLKNPLLRARYLCELHGVDLEVESNTSMPAAFLMAQLEWREALDDALASADVARLNKLDAELNGAWQNEVRQLAETIDVQHDYPVAAQSVRRMMFLDKTREDVDRAIDALLV